MYSYALKKRAPIEKQREQRGQQNGYKDAVADVIGVVSPTGQGKIGSVRK